MLETIFFVITLSLPFIHFDSIELEVRKMLRLCFFALLLLPSSVQAGVISNGFWSDNFDSVSGTEASYLFPSSEKANGQWLSSVTVPGWTIEGGNPSQIFGFSMAGGDRAIGINEDLGTNSISQLISGFTVGQQYVLSFEYWGDNHNLEGVGIPGTYSFLFQINGQTESRVGFTAGLNLGTSNTEAFLFTATASFSTLRFTETIPQFDEISPLFDNVSITAVPEPASFLMIGLGGVGVIARRLRKSN